MSVCSIDNATTFELLTLFNAEDKKVANEVEKAIPDIAKTVDVIVGKMQQGGRLFYLGSGSGGKIAILDATECPPTFGVDNGVVIPIISGGTEAAIGWREDTEDDEALALHDLKEHAFSHKDVLIAVTASGNTPYALAGVKYAASLGAETVGLCCNVNNKIKTLVKTCITIDVGDEILLGSTRLKAGTAQKMVLNMISSCSMMKMGKTYRNLMVDVRPINLKLQQRVISIIRTIAEVDETTAKAAFEQAEGNTKVAVVMLKKQLGFTQAVALLRMHGGFLSKALGDDL